MTSRTALLLLMSLLLAGCQTLTRVQPSDAAVTVPSDAARAAEQLRRAQVQSVAVWGFTGRVAVSQGKDGGSGRLEWRQDGQGYQVRLSAPVTRQGWELSVDEASARAQLEGLPGGPRIGADARVLVAEATGWDLPVHTLGDWVRGLVGPAARLLAEDTQGRPLRAEQNGWQVDFTQWYDGGEGHPVLPRRIDASRGSSRVRLLVDEWNGWEQ